MANNDKSKTSKTARVMNLLSKKNSTPAGPAQDQPTDQAVDQAVDQAAAPAESRPSPTPPILSSIGADAAASNQIKSALESALEAELNPVPEPEPAAPVYAEAPAPQPDPIPEVEAGPEDSFVPEPTPIPEPAPAAVSAPAAPPTPAASFIQPTPVEIAAEQLGYINVMQVLVEEKAPKYIKMFGLCGCKRCLEDVKALTLNNLPPKYVVMAENEMIPKLTFYEGKYTSDITAQLLHACKLVAERPHHTRD